MIIKFNGKNIQVTDALKNVVSKKFSKLEKYFDPNVIAHVTLGVEKNNQIIEVTIPFNGVILRGEESNDDMYAAIDIVMDKLERQVRKQKTKLMKKMREGSLRFSYIPDYRPENTNEVEPKIVKTKRFAVKPMSSEEAVLQMELLGHSFFVFKNAEDDEINVVYKRKDGNYG